MTPSNHPISPLTLGTVQLGLEYGIANQDGLPSEQDAFDILDHAWTSGIHALDTARAYGQSEARIGSWLKRCNHDPFIITKVSKFTKPSENGAINAQNVRDSLALSKRLLGKTFVSGLMMHTIADLFRPGVGQTLMDMVDTGEIGGFGASAYHPEDVDRALHLPGFTMVQLPLNLFDQRMLSSGVLERCRAAGVSVFVRSVFLQGLFFLAPDALPPHLQDAAEPLRKLHEFAHQLGRSVAELCFVTIRDTPGVTSLVIGAERLKHIDDALSFLRTPKLTEAQRKRVLEIGDGLPEHIYHPGKWN